MMVAVDPPEGIAVALEPASKIIIHLPLRTITITDNGEDGIVLRTETYHERAPWE